MISEMDEDGIWEWEKKSVISELTQGRKLANELKKHLHSRETSTPLIHQILSCYDSALALFHYKPLPQYESPTTTTSCVRDSKQEQHDAHKKRKRLPKKGKQVVECSKTGFEGQTEDDGFHWRKYGQKVILGANHPRYCYYRAYYRCTHRYTQGCLATKLVQRTDKDPSQVELVYKGSHSCVHKWSRKKKENVDEQTSCHQEEGPTLSKPTLAEPENVKTQLVSDPRNIVATTFDDSLGYNLPSYDSGFPHDLDMDFSIEDLNMILFDSVHNFDNSDFVNYRLHQ